MDTLGVKNESQIYTWVKGDQNGEDNRFHQPVRRPQGTAPCFGHFRLLQCQKIDLLALEKMKQAQQKG